MTKGVRSYRDLLVWQLGIELAAEINQIVGTFPNHERYGLADQLRRSAISVPSNIAEGQARQHTNEFRQFLYIALGSLAEVDTQVEIARRFGYCDSERANKIAEQISELRKMLYGLIAKLPD